VERMGDNVLVKDFRVRILLSLQGIQVGRGTGLALSQSLAPTILIANKLSQR
jgi:hypothetical protein